MQTFTYPRLLIVCLIFSGIFFQTTHAQGPDEMQDILETCSMEYQDLANLISDLPDHLLMSNNELDSKGDELAALSRELKTTIEKSDKQQAVLHDELSDLESVIYTFIEDSCPKQEAALVKVINQIEPILELATEPIYILSGVDNRYDEKFLLKVFSDAKKATLKVESQIRKLQDALMKVLEKC